MEQSTISVEIESEKDNDVKLNQNESFTSNQSIGSNLFDLWHPYLHYPAEVLRTIRASGSEGASINDLHQSCAGFVTKKATPRVIETLQKAYPDEIKVASEEKSVSKNRSLRLFK